MLRDIWTLSLVEILPQSILQDSKLKASAEALDFELQKLSMATREALFIPRIDELSHEVLDLLANQFHVDFYEPTEMEIDTKRSLIRSSIYEHRIKGTRGAVERLLNKITSGATVEEWFNYGGRPGYFRVNLKGLRDYGDEGETFMRMINATKNERSWLDDILFDLTREHPDIIYYVGQVTHQRGEIKYRHETDQFARQSLQVVQSELTSGRILHGLNTGTRRLLHAKRVGFVTLISGHIHHACDREQPDTYDYADFERYLRARWAKFRQNPVIQHYGHNHHDWDGELDDPEGDEFFPVNEDFLRLYWRFGDKTDSFHVRYTTILNPRDNISAGEINAVGQIGAATQMLLHSKAQHPTLGIFKALYIHRRETKII